MSALPEVVAVDLDPDEVDMLIEGLSDWGGPADGSDALAVAMGFHNLEDLYEQAQRLIGEIKFRRPMTVRDWTRALVATEFAYASDVLGSAGEWIMMRGGDEAEFIERLRRLQRKVPADPALLATSSDQNDENAHSANGRSEGSTSLF